MSISGMSDLLETPEGLDGLDGGLTMELIGDNDQDEDNSLLDAALGDAPGVDKDLTITPTDEQSDAVLDETNDNLQVEDTEEIEDLKARVKEMEDEAEKLKEIQGEVEKQMMSAKSPSAFPTPEEKMEADSRSVYIGNVDYQSTAEELGQHFQGCGAINRVTILCDKFTGHPKGFAYIEFIDKPSITQALDLDDSLFKGRQIKVGVKRTNRPGVSTTNRGGRVRGRGRGGFRGSGGYNPYMGGMMMMPMPPMGYYRGGRGRTFRGRARSNWYAPY